eukprot:2685657-Prorocentrum_lima.AAC.1
MFEEDEVRARRNPRTRGQPRWDKHRGVCIPPTPTRDMMALGALQAQLSAQNRRDNELLPPPTHWGTTEQDVANA